jgi:hypothetical protein
MLVEEPVKRRWESTPSMENGTECSMDLVGEVLRRRKSGRRFFIIVLDTSTIEEKRGGRQVFGLQIGRSQEVKPRMVVYAVKVIFYQQN